MVAETPDMELRPGLAVAIHGLTGAPELNGKQGTCEQWDADKGRWTVRMPDGELKALKPENLQQSKTSSTAPTKTSCAAPSKTSSTQSVTPSIASAGAVVGAVCVIVVAVLLQLSQAGGVSPAEYVKELFEPFEPPPPKAPKDTVVISFCQGWGTNGLYNQIAQLIHVRADKPLEVMPVNHPAPPLNVLLSQIATMANFALIGATAMGHSMLPPGMLQNKVASCMGIFFLGNMISGGLTKTNAFEIYLDGQLLWSTLETHRKPTMEDLVRSFKKAGIRLQG